MAIRDRRYTVKIDTKEIDFAQTVFAATKKKEPDLGSGSWSLIYSDFG
jgi:hypothetical protein